MTEGDAPSGSRKRDLILVGAVMAAISAVCTYLVSQRLAVAEFERTLQRDAASHQRQFELLRAELQNSKALAELEERHERERLEITQRMEAEEKLERLAAREAEARRQRIDTCLSRGESARKDVQAAENSIRDALMRLLRSQQEIAALTAASMAVSASGSPEDYSLESAFGDTQPLGRLMLSLVAHMDELAIAVEASTVVKPSDDTNDARLRIGSLLTVPLNLVGQPEAGMLRASQETVAPEAVPEDGARKLEPNLQVARVHMRAIIQTVGDLAGSARADLRREEQKCYDE